MQPFAADGLPTMTRAQEIRMAEDELRGDQRIAQKALLAIAVGDDRIEEPRTLAQPDAKRLPLGSIDDERDRVELPRPVGSLGDAEDVERHLLFGDPPPNGLPQELELLRRVLAQKLVEQLLVRTQSALGVAVLVEHALVRDGSDGGRNRGGGDHQGRRRRSSVIGKWGSMSGSATPKLPGMCPILSKRAILRLSAAAAFTGRSSGERPPGCTTW